MKSKTDEQLLEEYKALLLDGRDAFGLGAEMLHRLENDKFMKLFVIQILREFNKKDQKIAELESQLEEDNCTLQAHLRNLNYFKDEYDQAVKDIKFLITIIREIWLPSWQIEEIRKRHGISEE